MSKLVRIHPVAKKQGFTMERYRMSGTRYPNFVVGTPLKPRWYTVTGQVAKHLATVKNSSGKLAFQVCTQKEAEAMDRLALEEIARATGPVPLPAGVSEEEDAFADVKKAKKEAPPSVLDGADEDDLAELEALEDEDDEDFDFGGGAAVAVKPAAKARAKAKKAKAKKKTKPVKKRSKPKKKV